MICRTPCSRNVNDQRPALAFVRYNVLKLFLRLFLVPLLLVATHSGHALDANTERMNLSCVQDLSDRELKCDYRMYAGEPVTGISAVTDGKPLTIKQEETYPWDKAVTAILILVDTSDPARQNVIEENRKIIQRILEAAAPHDQIGLGGFDKSLRLVAPIGSPHDLILASSGNLRAAGMTTELYRSLLEAIEVLKKTTADRKSIYLLSDGLAEDKAYYHQDVVKAARDNGIVITSLGFPRSVSQSVGLQTLRRLSEETGGIFVESDNNFHVPDDFLQRPFASMDSGGRFVVSIADVTPSDTGRFTVAININSATGSHRSEIPLAVLIQREETVAKIPAEAAPTGRPAAQPPVRIITREAAPAEPDYFWSWYLVLIALLFLLILVISAFFMTVYRQGKKRPAATAHAVGAGEIKPYAYLVVQDETKKRYPITRTTWRIGRGSDNEMTLQDSSVSRRHAEIHRDKGDVFTIFDLDSLNGVFVNDDKVHKQILHEGDIIDIGDICLRFTLLSNEYALEESTVMQHTRSPLTH